MKDTETLPEVKIAFPPGFTVLDARSGYVKATFDPWIKLAHWLTLLLIILVFCTAALINEVPGPWRLTVLQLHRSFGLVVWLVTIMRLAWRQYSRFPDWPATMTKPMRIAAHFTEFLLYGLLLLQPFLGLLHTNAHGGRVDLFFAVQLPSLIDPDDELAELLMTAHEAVAKVLLSFIALHTAAALFHHYILRDATLQRMLPKM